MTPLHVNVEFVVIEYPLLHVIMQFSPLVDVLLVQLDVPPVKVTAGHVAKIHFVDSNYYMKVYNMIANT